MKRSAIIVVLGVLAQGALSGCGDHGNSNTGGARAAASPLPVERLTPSGTLLREFEALLVRTFHTSNVSVSGASNFNCSGDCGPLSKYRLYRFTFAHPRGSRLRLGPRHLRSANFGNYPIPVRVSGRYIRCTPSTYLVLYPTAASFTLDCLAATADPRVGSARPASLRTFAGTWFGHTRLLRIARNGGARELIGESCCNPIIRLRLRLSRPRGSSTTATVRARVTAVQVYDRSSFSKKHPAPHVGERKRIRLRNGVIHERVTGTKYCDTRASRRGVCGA